MDSEHASKGLVSDSCKSGPSIFSMFLKRLRSAPQIPQNIPTIQEFLIEISHFACDRLFVHRMNKITLGTGVANIEKAGCPIPGNETLEAVNRSSPWGNVQYTSSALSVARLKYLPSG